MCQLDGAASHWQQNFSETIFIEIVLVFKLHDIDFIRLGLWRGQNIVQFLNFAFEANFAGHHIFHIKVYFERVYGQDI